MKDREETIAFEMNYCQHYAPKSGGKGCNAGCDIDKIQCVEIPGDRIKWGPCIGGHKLADPLAHCPKWIRRTREMGEKRADDTERAIKRLTVAGPFISAWRKKETQGKQEVVECPVCKGRLYLSQSAYNGHVQAKCQTPDCINFIE